MNLKSGSEMKNLSHFSKTDIRSWQRGTRCSIYFPVGAGGGGVTTSLCWVQAPSPKADSRIAMIMIFFRNFNLSSPPFLAGCSRSFRRRTKQKQCFSSLF